MSAWSDYFAQIIRRDRVVADEPKKRRDCGDCPAHCMYREYVAALRAEPKAVQQAVLERWFCHNGGRCFGARMEVLR